MKRNEMTTAALLAEAAGLVAALVYVGLQIYYGVSYGLSVGTIAQNLAVMILVYAGLTMPERYPEWLNGLPRERCVGKIRIYTIRMVRVTKLIFVGSLLFTSICDAMGNEINAGYCVLVIALIVVVAVYYEYRIVKLIRSGGKKD